MEGEFTDPGYWTSFYGDDDEQFDWYSAPGLTYTSVVREIVGRPRRTAPTMVLDVGCGTAGHLGALARRRDVVVFGVDFSPRVVELAAELGGGDVVEYAAADARRLPFRSGSLDVVVDKGCLDCFVSSASATARTRAAYLSEVDRVLKPDGVYILCAVCDVDIVSLLGLGVALRHDATRVGPSRDPVSDWERARSGAASPFVVSQIVSFMNKHVYRCVRRAAHAAAAAAANGVPAAAAAVGSGRSDGGGDYEASAFSSPSDSASCEADPPLDFDDLPTDALGLHDGVYCGSCGLGLFDTVQTRDPDGLLVPSECPACAASFHRFALS